MSKPIKLKNLLKEHTLSLAGGVVSKPAFHNDMSLANLVKEKYGTTESEPQISSEQILSKIQEFGNLGKSIYQEGDLKQTAKTLSDIANAAKVHTLRETEDWFDKVTVNRNMKELTNLSNQFGKLSEEASSVQQRLSALYEDMGNVLSRYYDLNETHDYGHESDDAETPEIETGEENPYQEPVSEADDKYAKFFRGALNKFGVSSPAELGDKKQAFYNYVDKNYQAKQETD
jgi:intein-encoded DNA endonuclease-like protein